MIGHLLNSFAPLRQSQTRDLRILESVTEDEHTRGLLFPDASSYQSTQGAAVPLMAAPYPGTSSTSFARSFDDQSGDLEVDQWKDIRIIVAQDEIGSHHRTVLYDSKRPSPASADRSQQHQTRLTGSANNGVSQNNGRRVSSHARRTSLSSSSETSSQPPTTPERSVFNRNSFRRTSLSSMPNIEEAGNSQVTELDEITRTYLDCMFGNTAISYKGPTTKLHHITPRDRGSDAYSMHGNRASAAFGSLSGMDGRRRSQLGQYHSTSLTGAHDFPHYSPYRGSRESGKRNVLITRTFTVTIPDKDQKASELADEAVLKMQFSDAKSDKIKFNDKSNRSPRVGTLKGSGRLRRLPSYAIAVIFHLPPPSSLTTSYKRTHSRPGRRTPRSSCDQDLLGSSADSERQRDWIFIDRTFNQDSLASTLLESDVNDRLDMITQHWDIISRVLAHLQHVIQSKLLKLINTEEGGSQTDANTQSSRSHTWNHSREVRSFLAASSSFTLPQFAFLLDREVKTAANNAMDRILRGVKIPRVITGQGRWGIWREEARWIGLWAGGREQNFFFFNLLTAFLGHHTEWLSILGPSKYRKRHHEQHRLTSPDNQAISNRTIIVSSNKMAARRLIFLLSAFLPASQPFHEGGHPLRSKRSASARGYSQSPPASSMSRETSLRKQIRRRAQPIKPTIKTTGMAKADILSPLQLGNKDAESENKDGMEQEQRPRRQSTDVRSLKSGGLPTPTKPENIKFKSSAVTTSRDTTPEAIPVAHFTNKPAVHMRSRETLRPGSSGSVAEANLMNTLQRSDSANMSNLSSGSQTGTRWGSFMSLWSNSRRESSTDQSDFVPSTDDGLGISGINGNAKPMDLRRKSDLQQMVDEVGAGAGADGDFFADELEYQYRPGQSDVVLSPHDAPHSPNDISRSQARAIPERPKSQVAPLKLSVNENDGVIDVDVPIPGFGSIANSPNLAGMGSFSSMEDSGYQHSFRSGSMCDFEQPTYVAGWLKAFHPDFVLQAVTPYAEVESQIKSAMRSEPTPQTVVSNPPNEKKVTEKWVDVCTTLVANAQTFSIKRLRLRRRVRLVPQLPSNTASTGTPSQTAKSQYGNPYSQNPLTSLLSVAEHYLEERFIEEPIMDMDGTLADAIERLLAQDGVGPGPGHGQGLGNFTGSVNGSNSIATAAAAGGGGGGDGSGCNSTGTSVAVGTITASGRGAFATGGNSNNATAAGTANPSRAASVASSPSSSWRGRNEVHGIPEIARGQCKEMVMGALREVVRSVTSNWTGGDKQYGGRADNGVSMGTGTGVGVGVGANADKGLAGSVRSLDARRESTLREGIRRWLAEVEEDS